MKAEQTRNNVERTAKTVLATAAAALALAACGEQDSVKSTAQQEQPAQETMGPITKVTAKYKNVQVIKTTEHFPPKRADKECKTFDVSPQIIDATHTSSTGLNTDWSESEHLDAYSAHYYYDIDMVQILQKQEIAEGQGIPINIANISTTQLESEGGKYVFMDDSRPNKTTVESLITESKDPAVEPAHVVMRLCVPADSATNPDAANL